MSEQSSDDTTPAPIDQLAAALRAQREQCSDLVAEHIDWALDRHTM